MEGKTSSENATGRAFAGRAILAAFGITAAMVVLVACQRQDPIAPEGSVISVSADPQTVVSQGGLPGRAKITATLRSKNGVRLPDQEVTFATTAGVLTPVAQTPILSDSQGQATSLLDTTSSATVTASSGSINGTTTVNVVSGNLSSITLDASPQDLSSCTDLVDLTVEATDPGGTGVAGVTVVFSTSTIAGLTQLKGSFNPTQPRTDATGVATSVFTPNQSFCSQSCDTANDPNAPNGGACGLRIIAKDVSGAFVSPPVDLTESIP